MLPLRNKTEQQVVLPSALETAGPSLWTVAAAGFVSRLGVLAHALRLQKGFSLIETVAAVGLIGTAVVGSVVLLGATVRTSAHTQGDLALIQLIRSQVETIQNVPIRRRPQPISPDGGYSPRRVHLVQSDGAKGDGPGHEVSGQRGISGAGVSADRGNSNERRTVREHDFLEDQDAGPANADAVPHGHTRTHAITDGYTYSHATFDCGADTHSVADCHARTNVHPGTDRHAGCHTYARHAGV